MQLTYKPAGQEDPTVWVLNLGKLLSPEAEAIEKVTGMNYGLEYKEALLRGNMRCRRAILWVLQRRTHPTIKFDDVSFADDELSIEMTRDEWIAVRNKTVEEGASPEVLAAIDKEIDSAPDPSSVGKAPVGDAATNIS